MIEAFNPEKGGDAISLEERGEDDIDAPVDGQVQEENEGMASTYGVPHQAIKAASRVLAEVVDLEKPELNGSKRRVAGRVKPVSVDLELLKAVADQWGIQVRGGKGHGYDHALLEILSRLQHGEVQTRAEPSVSQTVADQAKTLAWLTGRVEGLEQELVQVKEEKEEKVQNGAAQRVESLQQEMEKVQAENQRLKEELQQTQSRLENIQNVLSGGAASDQGKKTAILTKSTQVNSSEFRTSPQTLHPP